MESVLTSSCIAISSVFQKMDLMIQSLILVIMKPCAHSGTKSVEIETRGWLRPESQGETA